MMNQVYRDASEALHAAYELSERLHRPVWRHTGVDSRGATVWVVSLERDAAIALQGLVS
jgi:hypothetical protein